jgi:hypothetical protein
MGSTGPVSSANDLKNSSRPPTRGDDLHDDCRFVAGVPKGVPLISRLEDQITRAANDFLPTKNCADPPSQYVGVLILIVMSMHGRCERFWLEDVLQ